MLINFTHREYFYELVLKNKKGKKRIIIYYPFGFSIKNGIISFDYRLSLLKNRCPLEQLYNVLDNCGDTHPFLNNIIHICEQT